MRVGCKHLWIWNLMWGVLITNGTFIYRKTLPPVCWILKQGLSEKAQKMSSSLFVGALMLREVAPATNFPISLFPHKAFTGWLQSAEHKCTFYKTFINLHHHDINCIIGSSTKTSISCHLSLVLIDSWGKYKDGGPFVHFVLFCATKFLLLLIFISHFMILFILF